MILGRKLYVGLMDYPGIDRPIPMPELRIISDETFEASIRQRQRNRDQSVRNRKYNYLLVQHLRCPCGRAMIGLQKQNGRYNYYMCAGRSLPSHLQTCKEPNVKGESVEPQVWGWVAGLLTEPEALTSALRNVAERSTEALTPLHDRVKGIDAEIDRLERRIGDWVAQYADASEFELGALKSQVRRASDQMTAHRDERNRAKAEIARSAISPAQFSDVAAVADQLREYIPHADYEAKRYVLDRLDVQARLKRNEAGELICEASADALGSDLPIETTVLRIAPPARPGRCCDNPPAPRSPGGRSG